MQLNPLKMISPATQKLLLGGIVGSLSYWADTAIADTQAAYPVELKARIAPQLPRNDELLTSIAPPAIMWVAGKKSPKIKEMAKGTVLYSGPHLMQRIVVNALNPVATAGLAMKIASPANNRIMQPMPVQRQTPAAVRSVGKYR